MAKKPKLQHRQEVTQATLNYFQDKPFELGKVDCAKVAVFHLKKLGVKIPVAKVGAYSTPAGARAALKRAFGVNTLTEVADKYLERIAPAAALVGDLIEFRGVESPIGALGIYVGNDAVLCFHEEQPGLVAGRIIYGEGDAPLAAWRALPL